MLIEPRALSLGQDAVSGQPRFSTVPYGFDAPVWDKITGVYTT